MSTSATADVQTPEQIAGETARRNRKASQVEADERISYCVDCVNAGMQPGEIRRLCSEKWGIGTRSISLYLSRAHGRILASHDKPVEAHRADAIAVYRSVIDNPEAEDRDRIKAQERIDKLLGLEIHLPKRIEHTGAAGGPITSVATVVHVDLSAKLAEYALSVRSAAIANVMERQAPQAIAITSSADQGTDEIIVPAE